jgi:hypothetical protein
MGDAQVDKPCFFAPGDNLNRESYGGLGFF